MELRNIKGTVEKLSRSCVYFRVWDIWSGKAGQIQGKAISLCSKDNEKKINIITKSTHAFTF